MKESTKKWVASGFVSTLLLSVAVSLGTGAAEATLHYSVEYDGPRDADAVAPLLIARVLADDDGAGYGYGYDDDASGYGYDDAGYGYDDVTPDADRGAGYGYEAGYGYGYDDDAGHAVDLEPGAYRLFAFLDLDGDGAPSEYEPRTLGVDENGNTRLQLEGGKNTAVHATVREAASNVSGLIRSADGGPVANASVTLTDAFGWSLNATTGPDGHFLVPDAPTGEDYDLPYAIHVRADGYEPVATGLVHNVTAGTYDAGTLVLTPVPPPNEAPTIESVAPKGRVDSTTPTVTATFSDDGPLDAVNVTLLVDGEPVNATTVAGEVTYTPAEPLAKGAHHVELLLEDADGAEATARWTFAVPAALVEQPECRKAAWADDNAPFRAPGLHGKFYEDFMGWTDVFRDDLDRFYDGWCDVPGRALGHAKDLKSLRVKLDVKLDLDLDLPRKMGRGLGPFGR